MPTGSKRLTNTRNTRRMHPIHRPADTGRHQPDDRNPGPQNFDFSAFKALQLSERFSLQFRAEFFNIFNHRISMLLDSAETACIAIANSTNFNNANFGEIGSTRTRPKADPVRSEAVLLS